MSATVCILVTPAWLARAVCVCAALLAGCSEANRPADQSADAPAVAQEQAPPSTPGADKPAASPLAGDESRALQSPGDKAEGDKAGQRRKVAGRTGTQAETWESGCDHGKPTAAGQRDKQPPVTPETPTDPSAKPRWACDSTMVLAKPVWQGKPAIFEIVIRNEGDADLTVKAKGG